MNFDELSNNQIKTIYNVGLYLKYSPTSSFIFSNLDSEILYLLFKILNENTLSCYVFKIKNEHIDNIIKWFEIKMCHESLNDDEVSLYVFLSLIKGSCDEC